MQNPFKVFVMMILAMAMFGVSVKLSWYSYHARSAGALTVNQLIGINNLIEAYRVEKGYYPINYNSFLTALKNDKQLYNALHAGINYIPRIDRDHWRNEFIYKFPSKS